MRTDLIAAWLVYQWLQMNAPEVAAAWGDFDVDDDVKAFAARVKGMYAQMDAVFASQSVLGRTAIDHYGLEDVAILGGGAPTILSAAPEDVMYWSDIDENVLNEAQAAGYSTVRVDARDPSTYASLKPAKSAIGTGLFHFMDDDDVRAIFTSLQDAGITTIVFNNVDPVTAQELMDQWTNMGNTMYARTRDEMAALLPDGWQIADVKGLDTFAALAPDIGEPLAQQASLYNVYRAEFSG